MKSDDIQKQLRDLQDIPVSLPRHRAKLRGRLLAQHAAVRVMQRSSPRATKPRLGNTRVIVGPRRTAFLGFAAMALLMVLGAFLLLSGGRHSPSKFLAGTTSPPPTVHQTPSSVPSCASPTTCSGAGLATGGQLVADTPRPSIAANVSDQTQAVATTPASAAPHPATTSAAAPQAVLSTSVVTDGVDSLVGTINTLVADANPLGSANDKAAQKDHAKEQKKAAKEAKKAAKS